MNKKALLLGYIKQVQCIQWVYSLDPLTISAIHLNQYLHHAVYVFTKHM